MCKDLNQTGSFFKDVSFSDQLFVDEDKKKKEYMKYLNDVKMCPFCDKKIEDYIVHIDEEHNRIGLEKVLKKMESTMDICKLWCFKVFALKFLCEIQGERVKPKKDAVKAYNELIGKMSHVLELTLSDLTINK